MIKHLISRELKYAFSFPIAYISLLLFCVSFTFLYSRGLVIIGIVADQEFINSPHAITATSIFFSILAMMVALPLFYHAGNREYQNGFEEILFTTPISRFQFFIGRFIGALCLMVIPAVVLIFINIIGVKLGLALGSIEPGLTMDFSSSTFVKTFFYIALPNFFIMGSMVFGLAVWQKKLAYSILGLALLNGCYLIGLYGLGNDLNNFAMGALIDPFGEIAFNLDTRYFSISERNSQEVQLTGHLLKNRILWLSISAAFLLFTYRNFSFFPTSNSSKNNKPQRYIPKKSIAFPNPISLKTNPYFPATFSFLSFKSLFHFNFRTIVTQLPYLFFVGGLMVLQIIDFLNRHHDYGVAALPMTYTMIRNISSYGVLLMLFLFFYAGEAVWNNRKNNFDELIDSTPHHALEMVLAQVTALWLSILSIYVLLFLEMIVLQISQGFFNIDFWHYATELFFQFAPSLLLWTCVAVFIQILVNQQFVALAICIALILGQSLLFDYMNWESHLLKIGSNGNEIFSDLNRYGPFLAGKLWFNLYWLLFGLLLLFPATLLIVRGKDRSILQRWKNRKEAWSPKFTNLGGLLFLCWATSAGFVYYNTQILNSYSTAPTTFAAKAAYETQYKKYHSAPMPQIAAARFFVDLFPKNRQLHSKSELLLRNHTLAPIDTLYFSTRDINRRNGWKNQINIPNAHQILNDTFSGFQIYTLSKTLQPQDSLWINIEAHYTTQGFENDVSQEDIVSNGSFINHAQLIPFLGYRKASEIRDAKERALRGLPKRLAIRPLETGDCFHCDHNQLADQHSWISMETIISTSEDQIAVTAGSLIKEWQAEGRNYFQYRVDHPSLLFNSFISGDYQIARRKWQGIDLEIYYDQKHTYNIESMLDEMENAMSYYTQNFGPYFHQQVRIIEFPRYNNSAQAFPGTMPYSESRGFILDLSHPAGNNPIASTIGHEIGHQWWGHQIVGADMQGSNLLTESFAEYSSLMIMKKNKGWVGMIDFLKYDYDDYLLQRNYETNPELPLYKVEEQPYLYYRKGSVVMYALAEMIGEKKVNQSLRNFLEEFRYQDAPFPRSIDYLRHLKKEVPDSLQYLINDLFYQITFFNNKLLSATSTPLPDGTYQVKLQLSTSKLILNKAQEEEVVAIQDWFELGFFQQNKAQPFALRKVKFDREQMTFTFQLDQQPTWIEIDPKYLFFDRNRGNNRVKVVQE